MGRGGPTGQRRLWGDAHCVTVLAIFPGRYLIGLRDVAGMARFHRALRVCVHRDAQRDFAWDAGTCNRERRVCLYRAQYPGRQRYGVVLDRHRGGRIPHLHRNEPGNDPCEYEQHAHDGA